MRSRSPKGVRTESNAIDPTTVRAMGTGHGAINPYPARLMRAVQIQEFGGPEVLEVVELPDPEPAEGEVVVEVARAGMNFADTHQRENDYLAKAELPLIPGQEVSGRTPDGRRVAAMIPNGAYAEKVAVPQAALVAVPDEVSDDQTAGVLLQGLTAWTLLRISGRRPARGERRRPGRRRRNRDARGSARQADRARAA